jgi:23S rRNA (uracil1939-C5)-methyltransferase
MDASGQPPDHVDPVDGISGLLFTSHGTAHQTLAYGSPYVTDELASPLGPVALTHHVQSFFQGNRYLLQALAARVLDWVPDGTVTDLFAGVGLFAVSLAANGHQQIIAVEGDRSSARDLAANAEAYGPGVRVEHGSVEHYLHRRGVERSDTIVLDPPRTGLSQEAAAGLVNLSAPRLVYVSCDPATLARDVRRFLDAGYQLEHIEAFDLFPNTAHVETLAVLTLST